MKRQYPILIAVTSLLCLTGCESKAGTGAITGGALGVGIGALAGGGAGAAIGAGVGAITGGLIGASLDAQEQRRLQQQSSQTYRRVDQGVQLTVNDVINLTKANVSDHKIIQLLQKTNSQFSLSSYEVQQLQEGGVSHQVINYMLYSS